MNFDDELERNRRLAKKDWPGIIAFIAIMGGIMIIGFSVGAFLATRF